MTVADLAEAGHAASEDGAVILTRHEAIEIAEAFEEKDEILAGLRAENERLRELLDRRGPRSGLSKGPRR